MDKLWSLVESSVILRGILAVMFSATACYMWARGTTVPDSLVNALMLILGSMFQAALQARKTE